MCAYYPHLMLKLVKPAIEATYLEVDPYIKPSDGFWQIMLNNCYPKIFMYFNVTVSTTYVHWNKKYEGVSVPLDETNEGVSLLKVEKHEGVSLFWLKWKIYRCVQI